MIKLIENIKLRHEYGSELKYKLGNRSIDFDDGRVLYEIVATKDFSDVKKGDIGGRVESLNNLSQTGDCWIYGGKVKNDVFVCNNAKIYSSHISGKSIICGNVITENSTIHSNCGDISGSTKITNSSLRMDSITICGNSSINGAVTSRCKNIRLIDAVINSRRDVIITSGFGSRCSLATFFKDTTGAVICVTGCFNDNIDEFEERVKLEHGDNKYGKEYLKLIESIRIHFEPEDKKEEDVKILVEDED